MSLGSIIAAGRAGGDSLRRSYVAALSGMPNFTDIYRTALNTRSAERVANTRAESTVAQAGIRANTRTKLAEMGAEYGEKIANEKLGARKFAGIVGGLGTAAVGGMMALSNKKEKTEPYDYSAVLDRFTEAQDASNETLANLQEQLETLRNTPVAPVQVPEYTPIPTISGAGGTDTTSQTSTTSGEVSAYSGGPLSEGAMSKSDIKNLAIQTGFSPAAASTVVGIAGGESGYDPTNSTKRSGLYDKTGEDSVGLMQINWGYHKDKGWLQKLGITKREDLYDPVKNMKAAKYLYDGRNGGFQDWTVYNENIYKDYL